MARAAQNATRIGGVLWRAHKGAQAATWAPWQPAHAVSMQADSERVLAFACGGQVRALARDDNDAASNADRDVRHRFGELLFVCFHFHF